MDIDLLKTLTHRHSMLSRLHEDLIKTQNVNIFGTDISYGRSFNNDSPMFTLILEELDNQLKQIEVEINHTVNFPLDIFQEDHDD